MVLGENYWRAALVGFSLEAWASLGQVLANDHRHVGLYYAGFLSCYECERVAEKLRVVKTDIGDYRQLWSYDVGAIEPAAKAYLDHSHVNLLLLEIEQRQSRGKLKKRGVERLEELTFLLHEIDDPPLGNHLSVYADAFAEVDKVRRRVQANLVASLLQNGRDAVRARALAVGAGYVYGLVGSVRAAEMLVQSHSGLKPGLISRGSYVLEHRS